MITMYFYKYEMRDFNLSKQNKNKPVFCVPYYSHMEMAKDLYAVQEKIDKFLRNNYGQISIQPMNFQVNNKKRMIKDFSKKGTNLVFVTKTHFENDTL